MIDQKLLSILVCPACKGPLVYDKQHQRLICKAEKLAYPIENGIPVMLIESAEKLSLETVDAL